MKVNIRRLAWVAALSLGIGLGARAAITPASSARPRVGLAEVDGSIDPGSGDFLLSAVRRARDGGLDALLIRLDTPGGLLETTRDIVKSLLGADVPVVVYVGPAGARAGSAGVFITLAGHVAAMAPGTNIGAAHPVSIGGEGDGGTTSIMFKKIENDTVAFVEAIAEKRQRNAEWAVRAVRESESITAARALELGVIDLVAVDTSELLVKIDGRKVTLDSGEVTLRTAGAELVPLEWSIKQRVLHGFADPNVAYVLLMIGFLGLLMEFYHPGVIVPGVVGALCLLMAGVAFQIIPVNVGALILILVSLVMFVAEVYVASFGLLAVGGAVCLIIGSLLLIDNTDVDFFADRSFGVGLGTVIPTLVGIFGVAALVLWKIVGSARRRPVTGSIGLVGETGAATSRIGPAGGKVYVHGEYWDAVAESDIQEQEKIRVVGLEGFRLRVERMT